MAFEPVVLFFLLGVIAGLAKSDLKIPTAVYEALSVYLLLAIGITGGVKLAESSLVPLILPGLAILVVGCLIPLICYPVLLFFGGMKRADSASLAAHYGSVSVVTFSVAVAFLAQAGIDYEGHMVVFLVLLEIPALVVGILLARAGLPGKTRWGMTLREVFFGKSIFLLIGGLIIGYAAGPEHIGPMEPLFFDLFKGLLAFFLLEMGLVAASKIADFRYYGKFLLGFAVIMPIFSAILGTLLGWGLGMSLGGTLLLATLYASASYIAAPAAMRIAVPEANPALSIGAALGVTFPFNIFVGVPLYFWMAETLYSMGG
ncbi:sodium-dependent bicarbonate transport family permease [Methylonatrum kenyense]|uniref:sodium-dependent bicarbonate transport family permease n=1 Tax=Methylonatrum kenyense TaxID=455253 RepID=UPI0020BE1CCB|nr:sodium-dependent bicarbonate transport family permease [Methylonatrum kenyense]MCK8515646.1 sodium-dependent bicarbonate transport family permease [Methylonatrum kenyense]